MGETRVKQRALLSENSAGGGEWAASSAGRWHRCSIESQGCSASQLAVAPCAPIPLQIEAVWFGVRLEGVFKAEVNMKERPEHCLCVRESVSDVCGRWRVRVAKCANGS